MRNLVAIMFISVVLVGCVDLTSQPVRNYCDSEVSYDLWKQETGYRLYLRVGTVTRTRWCQGFQTDQPREINLVQDVSSPEEADKLVDKYRQLYAEKVAAKNKKEMK